VQIAYRSAVAAAGRGDVLAVLALDESAGDFVRLNEDRASVQLLACDRSRIIANLSLPSQ
jgi:hypothetical protein